MKLLREQPWYSDANSQRLLLFCFALIALLAALDAVLIPYLGLPFLYLIPLLVAAAFLARWQVVAIAVICASFAEGFSDFSDGPERILRGVVVFTGYAFAGLFMREMAVYRRAASRRLREQEAELARMHSSQQRLELFMNSSAVAMITVSEGGKILMCNRAAHDLLGVGIGNLVGLSIEAFLPSGISFRDETTEAIERSIWKSDGRSFSAWVTSSRLKLDGEPAISIVIDPLDHRSDMLAPDGQSIKAPQL